MGEAKRRGTFEERKALAEAKNAEVPPTPPMSAYGIRPRGKSRAGLMIAAALAMSAGVVHGR